MGICNSVAAKAAGLCGTAAAVEHDVYAAQRGLPTGLKAVPRYATDLSKYHGVRYSSAKALKEGNYSLERSVLMSHVAACIYFDLHYWGSRRGNVGKARDPVKEFSLPLKWHTGLSALEHALVPPIVSLTTLPASYDCDFGEGEGMVRRGVVTHSDSDTECMFLTRDAEREIILAFRGTATASDIMTDLGVFFRDWADVAGEGAKCHGGFLGAWLAVADTVLDVMGKVWATGKYTKVFVCGHSLGGALATLGALHITKTQPEVGRAMRVYTYGSPTVGNMEFVASYDASVKWTYRHVNDRDLVTCVPPSTLGYDHVGTLITLNDMGLWIGADKACIVLEDDGHGWLEGGKDHSMNNYAHLITVHNIEVTKTTPETVGALRRAWDAYLNTTYLRSTMTTDGGEVRNGRLHSLTIAAVRVPNTFAFAKELERAFGLSRRVSELLLQQAAYVSRCLPSADNHVRFDVLLVAFDNLVLKSKARRAIALAQSMSLEAFERFDLNFDGYLDPDEFVSFARATGGLVFTADHTIAQIKALYAGYDIDADGQLSFEEVFLTQWAHSIEHNPSGTLPELAPGERPFVTPVNVWNIVKESEGAALRRQLELGLDGDGDDGIQVRARGVGGVGGGGGGGGSDGATPGGGGGAAAAAGTPP